MSVAPPIDYRFRFHPNFGHFDCWPGFVQVVDYSTGYCLVAAAGVAVVAVAGVAVAGVAGVAVAAVAVSTDGGHLCHWLGGVDLGCTGTRYCRGQDRAAVVLTARTLAVLRETPCLCCDSTPRLAHRRD